MPRVKKTIPAINQAADKMVAHLKETLARGEQVHNYLLHYFIILLFPCFFSFDHFFGPTVLE